MMLSYVAHLPMRCRIIVSFYVVYVNIFCCIILSLVYNMHMSRFMYHNPYDGLYHDGTYRGRPVIEDNTPIIGGVSYGEHPGEAIVVNPGGAPALYRKWYAESVARASLNGAVRRDKVLKAAYDTVESNMTYDRGGVDTIVQERRGKKIDLSRFMQVRVGVCRHMALASGMLLELHKRDGHIRGIPRVNRSARTDNITGKRSGHAWTRYNANGGEVMILDNAQRYFGSLEDSLALVAVGNWDYRATSNR